MNQKHLRHCVFKQRACVTPVMPMQKKKKKKRVSAKNKPFYTIGAILEANLTVNSTARQPFAWTNVGFMFLAEN